MKKTENRMLVPLAPFSHSMAISMLCHKPGFLMSRLILCYNFSPTVLQRLSSVELYIVEGETAYIGHFDDVNVILDIRQDNNNNDQQFLSLKNR